MIWSLYWRSQLLLLAAILLLAVLKQQWPWLVAAQVEFEPSLFWCQLAVIVGLCSCSGRFGCGYLHWGLRQPQAVAFYQRFQLWLCGFLLLLALLGALLAMLTMVLQQAKLWACYKLYLQPLLLLAGPAVVGQCFMQQQRRLSPGSLDAG